MTVPSSVAKSGPYICNGVTDVFNYDFRIVDKSHLNVILTDANGAETSLTLTTHYTVSDVGSDAGSINLTAAGVALAVTGTTLTILRNPPFTQETDLQNQGAYLAQTVEDRFDLLTMQIQTVKERSDRSIAVPASDEDTTLDDLTADLVKVAGIAADVSTVGDNNANVTTAADNIDAIIAAPTEAANAASSASTASASAGAAATSETNAATSASEAAASAASVNPDNLVHIAATDASSFGFVLDEDDMASDSDTKVPTQQSVNQGKLQKVATRTAMKALDGSKHLAVYLMEAGREGTFKWGGSDLSAKVTADTAEGIYVAPSSDATGASGAWVRVFSGPASIAWWGAKGDGVTDDSAAWTAAFAVCSKIEGSPGKTYLLNNAVLDGKEFNGNDCILRDAAGSRWLVKLTGFAPKLNKVTIQDQRGTIVETNLSAGGVGGETELAVASTNGLRVNQSVFIQGDTELWVDTIITAVGADTITLRDAMPETFTAGAMVVAFEGVVLVEDTEWYEIRDVLFVNTSAGLILKPSDPDDTSKVVGKGSISEIRYAGIEFVGFAKYGNSHDLNLIDMQGWGGLSDHFTYTGAGVAGNFGLNGWKVYLLRNVTVYVDGVPQVYGTDWEFLSQTSITFKSGHFPDAGATIDIYHFRDCVRNFIEDQRGDPFIAGGNKYGFVGILGGRAGMHLHRVRLSDFGEVHVDTCAGIGLLTQGCDSSCRFGKFSSTWAPKSIQSLDDTGQGVQFSQLNTLRVPSTETYAEAVGGAARQDNVSCGTGSNISINVDAWTGGDYQWAGPGRFNWRGANTLNFASGPVLVGGGVTKYIGLGSVENTQYSYFFAPADCTILEFYVALSAAPGAAQSVTATVQVNQVDVDAVVTLTGVAAFEGSVALDIPVNKGDRINLKMVTSASAASTSLRAYMVMRE